MPVFHFNGGTPLVCAVLLLAAAGKATSLLPPAAPAAHGIFPGLTWRAAWEECAGANATLCAAEQLCPGGAPFDPDASVPATWIPVADDVDAWLWYVGTGVQAGPGRCALGDGSSRRIPADPDGRAPEDGRGGGAAHAPRVYCCAACAPAGACAGAGGCSARGCMSPGPGETGLDCWAGLDGEPCRCAFGRARTTGREIDSHAGNIHEYTCCLPGPGAADPSPEDGAGGEVCGDYTGETSRGRGVWLVPVLAALCIFLVPFVLRRYGHTVKALITGGSGEKSGDKEESAVQLTTWMSKDDTEHGACGDHGNDSGSIACSNTDGFGMGGGPSQREESGASRAPLRQEKVATNRRSKGPIAGAIDPRLDDGASLRSLLTYYREQKKGKMLVPPDGQSDNGGEEITDKTEADEDGARRENSDKNSTAPARDVNSTDGLSEFTIT